MASFRRIIIAFAVMLFLTPVSLAQRKSANYQYLLERLLDGHHVINIVDDFLVFWDQAHDKSLPAQRRLFKRLVENKHREYFDRAVYRTTDPVVRGALLDEFLIRVPSQVGAIREFNKSITSLRESPLVEAVILFKARFRDFQPQRDIYVGLSMFRFDGAVRGVQNEAGVPDTLCLGAEVLSGYTRDQVKVAVAHELFHLYHFEFLFQQAEELSPSEFRTAHIPLLIEGMAAAGAEQVFPDEQREQYLHFTTDELTAQQRNLPQNAAQFLNLIRDGAPAEQYEQWFTHSHLSEAPPRGGYLLGYEVVKRVMAAYTLEQMVRMSPAELREHAEEQLAPIANAGIVLMAYR